MEPNDQRVRARNIFVHWFGYVISDSDSATTCTGQQCIMRCIDTSNAIFVPFVNFVHVFRLCIHDLIK